MSCLVIMATTTRTAVLRILSPCDVSSQCPDNATCLHALNRTQCTCNEGFVLSTSLAVCERAVYLNQPCVTRCAGFFMVCESTLRRCLCTPGYSPAADGKNCVETGRGLLGEACGMGCAFNLEQVCVDGVCRCMPGNRSMTAEEIRISNHPSGQCTNYIHASDVTTTATNTTKTTSIELVSQAMESTASQISPNPSIAPPVKPRNTSRNVPDIESYSKDLVIGLAVGFGLAFLLAAILASVLVVQNLRHLKQPSPGTYGNAVPVRSGTNDLETSADGVTNRAISQEHIASSILNLRTDSAAQDDNTAHPVNTEMAGNSHAIDRIWATANSNESNASEGLRPVREPEVPRIDIGTETRADVPSHGRLPLYMNVSEETDIYSHVDTPDTSEANVYTSLGVWCIFQ